MSRFDLVVRRGTVVTAADRFPADIGIRDGRIVALGDTLDRAEEELDASGKLVLPGGIDSHVHLDQPSPETGARSANDFRSGSISAACGGNTTILPFVRQLKGQSLRQAVTDYHERADGRSAIDYAFHLIVADPTAQVLGQELPALFHDGYTSVKVYMTYDSLKLADGEILRVLDVVREHGAMTMVHAENADCIAWLTEKLLDRGHAAPKYKAVAHAPPEEREATHRAITLAELAGVPILIVHVASGEAAEQIRWAQRRGLRVYAETCPQYLFLTEADIDKPDMEGAKCICAPPPGARRTSGRCGGLSTPASSRCSRPTTRRSATTTREASWSMGPARRSTASRTGFRASRRGCRCCSPARSPPAAWTSTGSSRSRPPTRRSSTGCIRARGQSPSARTRTSPSGTPIARSP